LLFRELSCDDATVYLESGRVSVENIEAALARVGRSLADFRHVFEFGCGVGRATRWLVERAPGATITASDVDPQAIGWLRDNLAGVEAHVNAGLPPLPFKDAAFDLVAAFSVFSHLDENYQDAWLAELRRVTAPGALLVLTVQGRSLWNKLLALLSGPEKEDLQSQFDQKGFAFWHSCPATDGLPDFYRAAFHTEDYVRRHWSQWFEVLAYLQDWARIEEQDTVVLRR
jgi:SAM-dependent methyltransferase